MFHQTIYASRDLRCKEPFGAVAAGQTIRFSVFSPSRAICIEWFYILRQMGRKPSRIHGMEWTVWRI